MLHFFVLLDGRDHGGPHYRPLDVAAESEAAAREAALAWAAAEGMTETSVDEVEARGSARQSTPGVFQAYGRAYYTDEDA